MGSEKDADRTMYENYRRNCMKIGEELLSAQDAGILDEQGVPAYVRGNALSRWVFWRRICALNDYLKRFDHGVALDFGCGAGMALPLLKNHFTSIFAVDVVADPVIKFIKKWKEHTGQSLEGVSLADSLESAGIGRGSLNFILAFDVLEHVENLAKTLALFNHYLHSDGVILVSGPTENLFYKIGRGIVGFKGDYHRRNIADIESEIAKSFSIKTLARLFYPATLFSILEVSKKSNERSIGDRGQFLA